MINVITSKSKHLRISLPSTLTPIDPPRLPVCKCSTPSGQDQAEPARLSTMPAAPSAMGYRRIMNILVVDDDPDIRKIAALALERLGGFRVILASNGAEALEMARDNQPDVVLLDVSMPGADGPETLLALRSSPATRKLPVIFFTATASE